MTPDEALRHVRRRELVAYVLIAASSCFAPTGAGRASLERREALRMERAWGRVRERLQHRAVQSALVGDSVGCHVDLAHAQAAQVRSEGWARVAETR